MIANSTIKYDKTESNDVARCWFDLSKGLFGMKVGHEASLYTMPSAIWHYP